MHTIEPYFKWRDLYRAEEDERSPFYRQEYSEFEFTNTLYNYLIHPQWDYFGSPTLYVKILYADYVFGYAFLELMGEWNDCIHNDIMFLKREVADVLMHAGINKFVLIGENVLNFHASDDCYYEAWHEDLEEDGWIMLMNFRDHVLDEMQETGIGRYLLMGHHLDIPAWRTFTPQTLFNAIELQLMQTIERKSDQANELP